MHSLRIRFSLYYAISRFWVHVPIWVIFFTSKGYTLTQLALINSSMWFSVILFEIPTGYVADRFGRKVSLISSYLVQVVGISLFVVGTSIVMLVASGIIWGIGITLSSGAETAWIYDQLAFSLSAANSSKTSINDTYFSWSVSFRVIGQFSMGSAQIVGGILASYAIWLPHSIIAALFVVTASILFTIPEDLQRRSTEERAADHPLPWYTVVIDEFRSREVASVAIVGILIWSFLDIRYFMQLDFESSGVSLPEIGIYFTMIMFLSSFGTAISKHVSKLLGSCLFFTLVVAVGGLFISMSYSPIYLVMLWFAIISLLDGIFNPAQDVYLNSRLRSEYRATTLSVIGAVTKLVYIAFSVAVGLTVDNHTFSRVYLWVGIIFVLVGVVFGSVIKQSAGKFRGRVVGI